MFKELVVLCCIIGLLMGIGIYGGLESKDTKREEALALRIALEDWRVKNYLADYPNYEVSEIRPQTFTTCRYEGGVEICNSTTYMGVWFDLNSGFEPEEYLLVRVNEGKVVDKRHFP